jgi:hypothetical protein
VEYSQSRKMVCVVTNATKQPHGSCVRLTHCMIHSSLTFAGAEHRACQWTELKVQGHFVNGTVCVTPTRQIVTLHPMAFVSELRRRAKLNSCLISNPDER